MIYAIIALILRLVVVFQLWKTGRLALSSQTRSLGRIVELIAAVSFVTGFFVYLFTLILLFHLGIRMWTKYKSGSADWINRNDLLLFILALIIFLKGPGIISLDRLLGNI